MEYIKGVILKNVPRKTKKTSAEMHHHVRDGDMSIPSNKLILEEELRISPNTDRNVVTYGRSLQTSHGHFQHAHHFIINGASCSEVHGNQIINNYPENRSRSPSVIPAKYVSENFTGRKAELQRLRDYYISGCQKARRKIGVICGIGGVGKTQICLKFIDDMEDSFKHIFWIDATSEDSLKQSFKALVNIPSARTDGVPKVVQSVLLWICHLEDNWLLVFDNADGDPKLIQKYLPPGNKGNIIITTRNPSMRRVTSYAGFIQVEDMTETDSLCLFLKSINLAEIPDRTLWTCKEIIRELRFLPLAIDQAAAYIHATNSDVEEYLTLYNHSRKKLLSNSMYTSSTNYTRSVYGTWDISFNQLQEWENTVKDLDRSKAAKTAIQLWEICSFFHHSNVSEDIFKQAAIAYMSALSISTSNKDKSQLPRIITHLNNHILNMDGRDWDEYQFRNAIHLLSSLSLIRAGPARTFNIHPLIHDWSRDKLQEREDWPTKFTIAAAVLAYSIPANNNLYVQTHDIGLHIKALLNVSKGEEMLFSAYYDDVYEGFGNILWTHGSFHVAEKMLQKTSEMRESVLGPDNSLTLASMDNLSSIYRWSGKFSEGARLGSKVLGVYQKMKNHKLADVVACMLNLASSLRHCGKIDEAEKLGADALEFVLERFGIEHPITVTSMNNIALTYSELGLHVEAQKLLTWGLEISERVYGPEHSLTVAILHNLAAAYMDLEDYEKASELGSKGLTMLLRILGPDCPDTITSMHNLAAIYMELERYGDAEKLALDVLEARRRVSGMGHADTFKSFDQLALIHSRLGRHIEAEQFHRSGLEMIKAILGEEHPYTLTSMHNLASSYVRHERYSEAQEILRDVIEISKRVLGPDHPDTLTSISLLTIIYGEIGRHDNVTNVQRWSDIKM